MKLSDTQRIILSQASQRDDRLAVPPDRLPAAARQTVAKSLLKQGLVSDEHASAYAARDAWQIDGRSRLLRVTDAGLRAIGVAPEAADVAPTAPAGGEHVTPQASDAEATAPTQYAPVTPADAEQEGKEDDRPRHERLGIDEALICGAAEDWGRPVSEATAPKQAVAVKASRGLKAAAEQVVAAWDGATDEARIALPDAINALRAALAAKPRSLARVPGASRKPREGTKREAVLALLRRPEGATVAQVAEATGWAPHTVRGFFAGLKKKGHAVEVLERIRQVGPNREGARGSYTVYHLPA